MDRVRGRSIGVIHDRNQAFLANLNIEDSSSNAHQHFNPRRGRASNVRARGAVASRGGRGYTGRPFVNHRGRGQHRRMRGSFSASNIPAAVTEGVQQHPNLRQNEIMPNNTKGSSGARNQQGKRRHILGYMRLQDYSKMDPEDLILELIKVKQSLNDLLKRESRPDWLKLLIKIFARASESFMKENFLEILSLLPGCQFLNSLTTEIQKLHLQALNHPEADIEEFINDMLLVFEAFLESFPSSQSDLPIDSLTLAIHKINTTGKDALQERVNKLMENRDSILVATIDNGKFSKRRNMNYPDGPPPDNFRELPIVPTTEDIRPKGQPYIRPIKVNGQYLDGEEYLDIQFRLLREDFIAPLREGITEITSEIDRKLRKQNMKIYNGVKIICPNCSNGGIIHRIQFDVSQLTKVPWQHSRRLIFGSIVCLSKDNFESFVFATVANRKPEDLAKGEIDVRFIGGLATVANTDPNDVFEMVESPSYYQAYCHVLEAMQNIDGNEMPFSNYIVTASDVVGHPQYLQDIFRTCVYNLSGCLTKPNIACNTRLTSMEPWKHRSLLNESQFAAVEKALTNEFVVIQGPPGTGKTFVGLRIAHALLQNEQYWNDDGDSCMLIVCYTNHALDQFLEGLIKMGHESLTRVGGRCQNEEISKYELQNKIRAEKSTRKPNANLRPVLDAKYSTFSERKEITEQLTNAAKQIEKVQRAILNGKIIKFQYLAKFWPNGTKGWFQNLHNLCSPVGISFLEVWLGLHPIPLDMVTEMRHENMRMLQAIDREKKYKEQPRKVDQKASVSVADDEDEMDIEGEAEELLDRWVVDKDEFAVLEQIESEEESEDEAQDIGTFIDNQGFQVTVPKKQERRHRAKQWLFNSAPMPKDLVDAVNKPWELDIQARWSYYTFLIQEYMKNAKAVIVNLGDEYEKCCDRLKELNKNEQEIRLRDSKIIAMTTTSAARLRNSLNRLNPKVVIIEEAAEVLEAHVITALSKRTEHVVLIGDHKQLKPKPTVYDLAKNYNLELSLFERMINNGMECHSLNIQHRMRPEIACLLADIYPNLLNHPSVQKYPDIRGVSKNLCFIDHKYKETNNDELKSKSNLHEAEYMAAFCWYLLLQGYKPEQITILALYTGQLLMLKELMPKTKFQGVRITAVDNFQGEENEIILLSLVRSNDESKIGFVGIENRICVALSRAKHGLFAIGNFSFLSRCSGYWRKIVNRVDQSGNLQPSLQLFCRNHPDTLVNAKVADDFKNSPEGGCTKPCLYRLKCGHVCPKACHPVDQEHLNIKCKKTCNKELCDLGHTCKKTCHFGDDCGRCMKPISKIIPVCEHEQRVPCSLDPARFDCKFPIEKVLDCGHTAKAVCSATKILCYQNIPKQLKCGHVAEIPCHISEENGDDDIECMEACKTLLECGHTCTGTCEKCYQGRLHVKCSHACSRPLVCSHLCTEPCSRECPPCREPCINCCVHSKCPKECGEICPPCVEPCKWKCDHHFCPKTCHQLCDRPPCNEPCKRKLKCGHACIGLCRERCPKLCRVCNKEEVEEIFFGNEDEENARFIQLMDCAHFFEVEGLDEWMKQNEETEEITLKVCPKCRIPIRKSWRYGNTIKRVMRDVNRIKEHVIDQRRSITMTLKQRFMQVNDTLTEIEPRCGKISDIGCREIIAAIQKKFSSLYQAEDKQILETLVENQMELIEMAVDVLERYVNGNNSSKFYIRSRLCHENLQVLTQLLPVVSVALSSNISIQQTKDAELEMRRISLLLTLLDTRCSMSPTQKAKQPSAKRQLDDISERLKTGRKIEKKDIEDMRVQIETIRKKAGLGVITKEEKDMIIKAIGLSAGHWYKCRNGHVYAIGECGGAMQTSKCPECKEEIGGQSHRLASGNAHASDFDGSRYAAWSEGANLENYDPREFQNL